MADGKARSSNVPNEAGELFSSRKQIILQKAKGVEVSKESRSQVERATDGQSCKHFSNKFHSVILD